MNDPVSSAPIRLKYISIGIIAWNEERALVRLLESLFKQSLFRELERRGLCCEIICVANGCTDRTVMVADEIFAHQSASHPHASSFACRAEDLSERGKIPSWNTFVHSLSAREAAFLFLMDADIVIHNPETLLSMVRTLEVSAEAHISVDHPCKEFPGKPLRPLRSAVSASAGRLTNAAPAQLCAQLYCIRSSIARNLYLPRDLNACDDGFIKALVCTDFLAHSVWPMRIQRARNAAHRFEAYVSPAAVFRNQKRQIIGQTIVHILVDRCLKHLTPLERSRLATTLRGKEAEDPDWLKKLIRTHLIETRYCWRLYPNLLTWRFRRLASLGIIRGLACLPAAAIGWVVALFASHAARKTLNRGDTRYWPRSGREISEVRDAQEAVSVVGFEARS